MTKPILRGPRVTLRDTVPGDVDARYALGNTPDIVKMFGGDPGQVRDITRDAAESWVKTVADDSHAWIIEAGGALLGSLRLHLINFADKRALIGIGILDQNALGHGYGTEAMQVLATHAFDTMGLHRLGCRVLTFNERAIAAYKKVGFVVEGQERESAFIDAEWHDDLIMGLLDRDLVRLT
ncbi:GNAT family N-acetyltransferase [Tateyamaria omphalii]|uniref:GNAT family N-acetyltransferase n=1 Tax=Tateyamaria omphalii TaxID=299262 RepID=UPI001C9998A2|nr:GNAT family protein [Tateyamaria omphalii]MBY5932536.1 GNAT family N-acetyltransferase [Tateyamaria omphalii]